MNDDEFHLIIVRLERIENEIKRRFAFQEFMVGAVVAVIVLPVLFKQIVGWF